MDSTATITYRALSLGAGVQSSVLALLLDREDARLVAAGYRKPDIAIFADTGWEPDYVYTHLDWLEDNLSFPLVRVSAGNLKDNLPRALTPSGTSFVNVPLFTINQDGKKGMLYRQCTNHYKILPIYKRIRKLAGGQYGRPFPKNRQVEMWLGISMDEIGRMKESTRPWVKHCWPLIDIGMSRSDCINWFGSEYPNRKLPRSACVICPYRSDEHWLELKQTEPNSYDEAVRFDKWMRKTKTNPIRQVLKGRPYLHSSRRPLDSAIAEVEKQGANGIDHFNNECEGHCGV